VFVGVVGVGVVGLTGVGCLLTVFCLVLTASGREKLTD
jgi:hypothetical protein